MILRGGFIFAATLWALVALTVLAAYIDGMTRTNVDNAYRAKRMLQAELDRRSTEATLLYLLGTNRMNRRNLVLESNPRFAGGEETIDATGDGVLGLGSEAYLGLGESAFSLQDELGLVSVNTPRSPLLSRVLESLGVPPQAAADLMPRLGDYIDTDRVLSLDGAEDYDYAQAGQAPPANWYLATAMELRRVLGVEGLLDRAQWQRLRAMTTPRLLAAVNFNTMPPEVAAAILKTDVDDLATFLAVREEESLVRLDRIRELTRQFADVDPRLVAKAPSVFVRVTTWWRYGGPRTVVGVTLTPASAFPPPVAVPWRTEYRYSEPAGQAGALRKAATPLLGGQPEAPGAAAPSTGAGYPTAAGSPG